MNVGNIGSISKKLIILSGYKIDQKFVPWSQPSPINMLTLVISCKGNGRENVVTIHIEFAFFQPSSAHVLRNTSSNCKVHAVVLLHLINRKERRYVKKVWRNCRWINHLMLQSSDISSDLCSFLRLWYHCGLGYFKSFISRFFTPSEPFLILIL